MSLKGQLYIYINQKAGHHEKGSLMLKLDQWNLYPQEIQRIVVIRQQNLKDQVLMHVNN